MSNRHFNLNYFDENYIIRFTEPIFSNKTELQIINKP